MALIKKKQRPTLLLHPGFPKTATTTLQNGLFAKHSECVSIGKPNYYNSEFKVMLDSLKWGGRGEYEKIRPQLAEFFQQIADTHHDKTVVLSTEILLGSDRKKVAPAQYAENLDTTASRLAETLDDIFSVKVLIGIRRQDDMVLSRAAHAFQLGLTRKSANYVAKRGLANPMHGVFSTQFFCRFADHFSRLFGSQNIGFLVFEELVHNSHAAVARICNLCQIEAEQAITLVESANYNSKQKQDRTYQVNSSLLVWMRRKQLASFVVNFFPFSIKHPLKTMIASLHCRQQYSLDEELRVAILDLYHDDNTRLACNYHLPLAQYGYIRKH